MKLLLLAVAVIYLPLPVLAQGGLIQIYNSTDALEWCIDDRQPGLIAAYVFHYSPPGALSSAWAAPLPACSESVFLSDTPVFPVTIGSSQSGIEIGYGVCMQPLVHVLTINIFNEGLMPTPACCQWDVVGHPDTGLIGTDCTPSTVSVQGGAAWFNVDHTNCYCYPVHVQTREFTWGVIKNLYSE